MFKCQNHWFKRSVWVNGRQPLLKPQALRTLGFLWDHPCHLVLIALSQTPPQKQEKEDGAEAIL